MNGLKVLKLPKHSISLGWEVFTFFVILALNRAGTVSVKKQNVLHSTSVN